MKRYSPKLITLIVALLMFSVGSAIDFTLRANVGPTCYGCSNFACKVVFLADEPMLFVRHPIESFREFFRYP